jgi:hypothetical protein
MPNSRTWLVSSRLAESEFLIRVVKLLVKLLHHRLPTNFAFGDFVELFLCPGGKIVIDYIGKIFDQKVCYDLGQLGR